MYGLNGKRMNTCLRLVPPLSEGEKAALRYISEMQDRQRRRRIARRQRIFRQKRDGVIICLLAILGQIIAGEIGAAVFTLMIVGIGLHLITTRRIY